MNQSCFIWKCSNEWERDRVDYDQLKETKYEPLIKVAIRWLFFVPLRARVIFTT